LHAAFKPLKRFTRSISEVWSLLEPRARLSIYPFEQTAFEDNKRILTALQSLDAETWCNAYSEAAKPYEARAREAEQTGDFDKVQQLYLRAWGLYRLARFPSPKPAAKREAYRKSQEMYLWAARFYPVPVERVVIPFSGRAGEGDCVIGYFRRPKIEKRLPLVLLWTGIDAFKDQVDLFLDPLVNSGTAATLAFDIPGTLDAPLAGSEDAERMWDSVFKWIESRKDLDSERVAGWGISTGGYWAAKVAHTHAERFRAVVNHGGAAHYTFSPEWIEEAQFGIYPFDLAEGLASVFGLSTFEEWVENAARFSLLRQCVLDRPTAPMLLVNGVNDSVFSFKDMLLLLEHGHPKTARFFPNEDHMGMTPSTLPLIVEWIRRQLS
jgi:esterase FrsA